MPQANDEVARLFDEIAILVQLSERSTQSFKVRAYENAARAVRNLTKDVHDMSAAQLADAKGIGKSTAAAIREWAETGRIAKLDELRELHPPQKRILLRIPGVGVKTIGLLEDVLGITDVDGLRAALDDGRIAELPGMGDKTADNLRESLAQLGSTSKDQRVPTWQAMPTAESLVNDLRALPGVVDVAYAGSLRRFREDVGDLDILVSAPSEVAAEVMAAIVEHRLAAEVIGSGPTKTSVRGHDGLQVDVRVVEPASFGAALIYFTGSKAHNIVLRQRALERGLTLNEYQLAEVESGRAVAAATEAEVYEALELPWIPPEQREDTGEFARSAGDFDLIEFQDIRGDLHDHTTYSGDGKSSLEDMVAGARARGFGYLAITDHAEDLRINGVSREGMREQRARVRELEDEGEGLALLHGAELNIDADGGLDYDDEFLAGFDWCVASVHSHFRLSAREQTQRLVTAIRHPSVNVIGHLTGRMIGKRQGIDLDLDAVFTACLETGTALEINSNLRRLDASADVVRAGAERGVTFVISTDAHHVSEYAHHLHGVRNARRAGLKAEQVANTWSNERFLSWAAEVRAG